MKTAVLLDVDQPKSAVVDVDVDARFDIEGGIFHGLLYGKKDVSLNSEEMKFFLFFKILLF